MRIDQLWSLLRQRLALAVAIFVVVAVGTAAWSVTRTPIYQAEADVYITIAPTSSNTTLYQDSQYILEKVKSYTQIAGTPTVLDPVVTQLGLTGDEAKLGDSVTATNTDGTSIITITATDSKAQRAADIADAVADQISPTISQVEPGDAAAGVSAKVVQRAQKPDAPIFPRNTLNIALGLIAGIVLGIGAAVGIGRIDQSVRSVEDMEELSGAAPLGSVRRQKDARRVPIPTLQATSTVTEDYRSIRSRLAFASVDEPLRKIVVTSAVPGDGKSTVAVNLAVVLAQAGSSVVLVEADVRRPKASTYLGVENAVGLTDVLAGTYRLEDALLEWGGGLMTVLPAGTNPPDPGELFASRRMHELTDLLAERFDYVICDTPPLLAVSDAAIIGRIFDGAILVAGHGHASRTKIAHALENLRASNTRLIGTVLNGVPKHSSESGYAYTPAPAPEREVPAVRPRPRDATS